MKAMTVSRILKGKSTCSRVRTTESGASLYVLFTEVSEMIKTGRMR
jgi:hypothetical protein